MEGQSHRLPARLLLPSSHYNYREVQLPVVLGSVGGVATGSEARTLLARVGAAGGMSDEGVTRSNDADSKDLSYGDREVT